METLFESTPCLTDADIRKYVGQDLNPEDRFRVENHLLDCPLCSEALDGFVRAQEMGVLPVRQELRILKKRLADQEDRR
mgnify:CR=1 FL=1